MKANTAKMFGAMCAVAALAAACIALPDRLGSTQPGGPSEEDADAGTGAAGSPRTAPDAAASESEQPESGPSETSVPDSQPPEGSTPPVNCDPNFTLEVAGNTPPPGLVAPDLPQPPDFGHWVVRNSTGEPIKLVNTVVTQTNAAGVIGDFQSIRVVGLDQAGSIIPYWEANPGPGQTALESNPPLMNQAGSSAELADGEALKLEVHAKMAVPVPKSQAKPGEPISGHAPHLEITEVIGVKKGQLIKACIKSGSTAWMKLRKSFPMVDMSPLPAPTLADGPQDIYCFSSTSATVKHPVAWKRAVYQLDFVQKGPAGFGFCNFFYKRDGVALEKKLYSVVKATSPADDLTASCISDTVTVAVTFTGEELVLPGQTPTFCLAATVTGKSPNSIVLVKSALLLSGSDITVDLCAAPGLLGLVWSDISEQPHGSGCPNGSADWYGDGYLPGLPLGVQNLGP